MANLDTFQYTSSVQEKILALMWQDKRLFVSYSDCVKPKYFQKAVHIDICRLLYQYYETYEDSPTLTAMTEEVRAMLEKAKSKAKIEDEYYDCLKRLSKLNINDLDYIKDKIISFGKRQAMIEAIMTCADIIQKGSNEDYDQLSEIIQKAQLVGEDVLDLGVNYWDGYEERIDSYHYTEDVIERISPGMGELLDKLMRGGLGRTEMGVILAPPGRGKTTSLVNVGFAAIKASKNVVHISLENNIQQILRNYDLRLLGKSLEFVQEEAEKCKSAIGLSKRYRGGNLIVKKYPTKGITVSGIRQYLNKLRTIQGIVPDVVIVDYGAIIRPETNYNDKRNTLESVYEDLRALADEFNVALWTAAQGNRSSLAKRVVTIEDLAESFAIANISDVMLALCQTLREKLKGEMRMFIAKNRDNPDGLLLKGTIAYETKVINMVQDISHQEAEEESDVEDLEDDTPRTSQRRTSRRSKQ